MVECSVELGERQFRCVNVHLGRGGGGRGAGAPGRVGVLTVPVDALIAGDLNAEPDSAELGVFDERGWRDAERLFAGRSLSAIHELARRRRGSRRRPSGSTTSWCATTIEVVEAFVPPDWERWAELSDHMPVVARLRV